MNKHLKDHDFIPLIPLMSSLLRRSKGNEHDYLMRSMFEYAEGNQDNAERLKRKCRRCLWKDIETYWLAIDQCYEVIDYAEQDH